MIATILSGVVLAWASVAIVAAIAIGKAIRLADDASRKVTEYVTDPDGRPIHPSQMLFVDDILRARAES